MEIVQLASYNTYFRLASFFIVCFEGDVDDENISIAMNGYCLNDKMFNLKLSALRAI